MSATQGSIVLLHISDIHFGGFADLDQIEALEEIVPALNAMAAVVSGDLSQRARHGEFQAAHAFLNRVRAHLPTLVIPGNHDVEWWMSPFGIRGRRRQYDKYCRYFGTLAPVLEVPGALIVGALSVYGVAFRSLTWSLGDVAVIGHLPRSETSRVQAIFERADPRVAKVLRLLHNVLHGALSRRMGLANWRSAHQRLLTVGADVVLCGHDHQEGAGSLKDNLPVSTAGTHSLRTRHGRPSVFNIVTIEPGAIHIQHYRWESAARRFVRAEAASFRRGGGDRIPVSAVGSDASS